jgi:hypothetical protein
MHPFLGRPGRISMLYRRSTGGGHAQAGDESELPGIGLHCLMSRPIRAFALSLPMTWTGGINTACGLFPGMLLLAGGALLSRSSVGSGTGMAFALQGSSVAGSGAIRANFARIAPIQRLMRF